ncbi:MAG: tetratricopeptide repeat protein [Bacteroidetes bacterium]|nr:tetratricopeptide repeat protein [Bacteroidota bacterium]
MVQKTDKTEEKLHVVEETLSKTEHFIENNQKLLINIGIAIVAIVLGFYALRNYYIIPREEDATAQMFMAQKYFDQDSIKKALNGDGNYPGFVQIIDDYKWTKAANLSHYYAGICYLKQGKFQDAIDQLKSFSGKDELVAPMAKGAIGDAYMELGQTDKAVSEYEAAANLRDNKFTTTVFLQKAAFAYEELKNYDKALELYNQIKTKYPNSMEASEVDKYIAKIKTLQNK